MPTVTLEVSEGLAVVGIDKPQRRNAITHAEFLDIARAVRRAGDDAAVRAVILTGSGPAFCAGADLVDGVAEAAAAAGDTGRGAGPEGDGTGPAGDGEAGDPMANATAMITAVTDAKVPVIAAVEGAAAGIGASLALACDLVVAAESAFFTLPFGRIGLIPDGGVCLTAAASLGRARAMELALRQTRLPAAEARAAGLVAEVVADGTARDTAVQLAAEIAAGAPREALAQAKHLVNAATLAGLPAGLDREARIQPRLLQTPGHREGVAAFLQHRRPDFR